MTVRALSNAVEARDAYTAHHAERVAAYGAEIAAVSGLVLGKEPQIEYGFLLHDIGTGDGIVVAMEEHYGKHVYQTRWSDLSLEAFQATANRIRTAPLWGVRMQPMLMHDGTSLTFRDAILRHGGEASGVTAHFESLSKADQEVIIEFLKSL